MNHDKIEEGIKLVLEGLGCKLTDQNFIDTPTRVAKVYRQMFASSEKGWNSFEETYSDMILMKGHVIHTLCPHHLLPVLMKCSIAYRPNGNVIGLSKLCRVLQEVNKGPVLQEAFTNDAAHLLADLTGATDVACYVEGEHGCMRVRGVRTNANVTTMKFLGAFENDKMADRFLRLVSYGNGRP